MSPRRAPSFARPRKPTFFWQGTLILLPAIILCAFGLYSLRQDRALAEHQALERARTIVRESTQRLLQGPLRAPSSPEASAFERAVSGLGSPDDDPVWHAAEGSGASSRQIAFLLDRSGLLI